MKKTMLCWAAALFAASLLTGCGTFDAAEAPTENESVPAVIETTEEEMVHEEDVLSDYVDAAYAEQISRYHTALKEQWDEKQYLDNGMNALPDYYCQGDPLENVGFGYVDLDNNDSPELVIGAILNAGQDPAVFEIWTLADGAPVMLAQGGSGSRYVLQYVEEDDMWYVVNEAPGSAYYYMMLSEGKLEIMQGIIFDDSADEENPWFLTYDMDGDVSNDDPIDEDLANAILESNRNYYTALEYVPYTLFIAQ